MHILVHLLPPCIIQWPDTFLGQSSRSRARKSRDCSSSHNIWAKIRWVQWDSAAGGSMLSLISVRYSAFHAFIQPTILNALFGSWALAISSTVSFRKPFCCLVLPSALLLAVIWCSNSCRVQMAVVFVTDLAIYDPLCDLLLIQTCRLALGSLGIVVVVGSSIRRWFSTQGAQPRISEDDMFQFLARSLIFASQQLVDRCCTQSRRRFQSIWDTGQSKRIPFAAFLSYE